VILVHGMWDTQGIFSRLQPHLERQGRVVYGLDLLPSNGDLPLEDLAQQLAAFIEATCSTETPIDVVGFSMGGIVSRYYLQRLGGLARVQRLVTIASPHHGTLTAYLSDRPGCQQLRPNHPFLQDLNSDLDQLRHVQHTSIWTPFDGMIVPAWSSVLPGAGNIWVPVPLHAWMVRDPRCLQTISRALAQPVTAPTGCDGSPETSSADVSPIR
jgi:triacylglycerol lipase